MPPQHRTQRVFVVGMGAALAACAASTHQTPTEANNDTPIMVEVAFEYQASTLISPEIDYATCSTSGVTFTTHLHFIWHHWNDRRYMETDGQNLFTYWGDVPVGRQVEIALHDPNNCLEGSTYVAPSTLYANGVLLTEVVRVEAGTGLSFSVDEDGVVSP